MRLNQFSVRVIGGRETSSGYVEVRHSQKYSLSLRNDRDKRCDARVEIDGKHVGTWRIEARRNIVLERPADDDGCFTFYRASSKKAAKAGIVHGDPNNGLVVVTFTPEKYVTPAIIPQSRGVWPGPHPYPWPWYPWWPYEPYRPYKPWITYTWPNAHSCGEYTVDCNVSYTVSNTCASDAAVTGSYAMGSMDRSLTVQDSYDAGGTGLSDKTDQTFGVADNICHNHSQETTISLRLVYAKSKKEEPRPLVAQGNPVPPPV